MDREGEPRVRVKSSGGEVDRLSNLPESLKLQILLNLVTKDAVKTSVLSSTWRNLWRDVPGLDLGYGDFEDHKPFVSFVDRFLGFNSESCLQKFELQYYDVIQTYEWEWYDPDFAHIIQWINSAIKRKVQYFHLLENPWFPDRVEIPLTVYTCESLVSFKLYNVVMPNPKSVSLPSLKVIKLDRVDFANDWAFERLVSSCPVLERLTVFRKAYKNVKDLRVCSQSLLSFKLFGNYEYEDSDEDDELVVVIDAPRLEKVKIMDRKTDCVIIKNIGSLAKVGIDVMFNMHELDPNDIPKRKMIRNFLLGISSAREMLITSFTLKAIYNYSRCEPLPLFRNLSSLHADFKDYRWETLPIFLDSCPSLKSLSLSVDFKYRYKEPMSVLPEPHRFLPSLESVEIVRVRIDDDDVYMKLVSYFLENSTILKKFIFAWGYYRGNERFEILKKLNAIPRLSSACQVMVV